jgi:hypothetical protein
MAPVESMDVGGTLCLAPTSGLGELPFVQGASTKMRATVVPSLATNKLMQGTR